MNVINQWVLFALLPLLCHNPPNNYKVIQLKIHKGFKCLLKEDSMHSGINARFI